MTTSSLMNPLAQVPTDLLTSSGNRIEDKVRVAQSATGDRQKQELKKVAQEFEAIFMAQLLKVMRETIEESGLTDGGGFGKSIYTELFDQEVSMSMARRGALGISDLLYRSLSGRTGEPVTSAPDETPKSKTDPSPAPVNASPSVDVESDISDLHLPVQAPISSSFGIRRDPFTHRAKFHKGMDLAAPEGTGVVSALPGKVISAGYQNGYGNTVLVQHSDGVQTRYGHMASICVKPGEMVDSESVLGTVGSTGRSTGPHLHFEVIRMGQPVDPLAAGNQTLQVNQHSVQKENGRQKAEMANIS